MTTTIDGTTGIITETGTGDVSVGDDLIFTGTGNRITGDFSNATASNRVAFQTSTTNGATVVTAIPNGTSTTAQLEVFSNSDFTNGSNGVFRINNSELLINSGIRGTGTYLPMTFYTNNAERMRIDTSGRVSIGTSSTVARLQSSGAAATATPTGGSATGSGFYINNTDTAYGMMFGNSGNGDGWIQQQRSDSTNTQYNLLLQPIGGNVGIGVTSPARTLSVYAASNPVIQLVNSTTGTAATDGLLMNISGVDAEITNRENGTLALGTNNTERMRIDSSGNVGIGTTSVTSSRVQIKGANNTTTAYADGLKVTSNNETVICNYSWTGIDANDSLRLATAGTERMRVAQDGSFSAVIPSGSTLYPGFWCRAWVNFNGTGTVAIRASGNVTSITDNGTGNYRVNFTNNMPDANYSVSGMSKKNDGSTDGFISMGGTGITDPSVSSCAILTFGASSSHDALYVCAAFFR